MNKLMQFVDKDTLYKFEHGREGDLHFFFPPPPEILSSTIGIMSIALPLYP